MRYKSRLGVLSFLAPRRDWTNSRGKAFEKKAYEISSCRSLILNKIKCVSKIEMLLAGWYNLKNNHLLMKEIFPTTSDVSYCLIVYQTWKITGNIFLFALTTKIPLSILALISNFLSSNSTLTVFTSLLQESYYINNNGSAWLARSNHLKHSYKYLR